MAPLGFLGVLATLCSAGRPASTNVRISPPCDLHSYKSVIAVDPVRPWILTAGSTDTSGVACGALAGCDAVFCSTDAGNTWANASNNLSLSGLPMGDLAFAFNRTGAMVAGSILDTGCGGTGQCAIAAFGSVAGGSNWTSSATLGGAGVHDRPWAACDTDPASPYAGRFYLAWDRFTSIEENVAVFSTDSGTSFGAPATVRANLEFSTVAVGPGGTVYVAGVDDAGFSSELMCVSTDGGLTFVSHPAYAFQSPAGFPCPTLKYTGITRENMTNPGLDVDRASGRAYLLVIDKRSGQSRYHVFVTHTDDAGLSWSPPAQVDEGSDDAHEHGFPSLAVSPGGGVHAFYFEYGCAPSPSGTSSYRYVVSSSTDAGQSWHAMEVQDSSASWVSDRSHPLWAGDYQSGASTDRLIYPCWSDGRDGAVRTYVQPVPNPMPWVSAASGAIRPGGNGIVAVAGGGFVPTVTPFAVAFDDPGISGSIASVSSGVVCLAVSVATAVSPGAHEWSLLYAVPVGNVTVVAAVKSGCRHPFVIPEPPIVVVREFGAGFQVRAFPNPIHRGPDARVFFDAPPESRIELFDLRGNRIAAIRTDLNGRAAWRPGKISGGVLRYVATHEGRRASGTLGLL